MFSAQRRVETDADAIFLLLLFFFAFFCRSLDCFQNPSLGVASTAAASDWSLGGHVSSTKRCMRNVESYRVPVGDTERGRRRGRVGGEGEGGDREREGERGRIDAALSRGPP